MLELLVAAGAVLDAANAYGRTPLHYAAMNGRTDEVEALLAAGAAHGVPNAIGWTPLHDAAYNGQLAAAAALLAAGTPLHAEAVAVRSPCPHHDERTSNNSGGCEAQDIPRGEAASVGKAASERARPMQGGGDTPLALARENGQEQMVELLTEAGRA